MFTYKYNYVHTHVVSCLCAESAKFSRTKNMLCSISPSLWLWASNIVKIWLNFVNWNSLQPVCSHQGMRLAYFSQGVSIFFAFRAPKDLKLSEEWYRAICLQAFTSTHSREQRSNWRNLKVTTRGQYYKL
jgi:hypothetical protein